MSLIICEIGKLRNVGRSPLSLDLLENACKSMISPQTGHHKAFMDVFYSYKLNTVSICTLEAFLGVFVNVTDSDNLQREIAL